MASELSGRGVLGEPLSVRIGINAPSRRRRVQIRPLSSVAYRLVSPPGRFGLIAVIRNP